MEHMVFIREVTNPCSILVGIYVKQSSLYKRCRHQWGNYIKTGIKEMGCDAVDYFHLAQDHCHMVPFSQVDRYF